MKKKSQISCITLALIGVILSTGCRAKVSTNNSSPLSDTSVTVETGETEETKEPEYSVDLVLTIIFPNKTKYTSTDNGITWTTDGETVYYHQMPASLTVMHPDPISISGEIPTEMTIHNNNNETDMLIGGSEYELLRCDENGEWVPAEYADKTVRYGFTQQADLIYNSWDYGGFLSLYEPIAGRYRLTKSVRIGSSGVYGLMNPSDPGGTYIMSAEFNALP